MKKLLPILIIAVIIIIVITSISKQNPMITTQEGNTKKLPIEIIPNHFHDIECAMTIESEINSAQAISPSGKTWFFDDVGCLMKWLEDKSFKDEAILWVYAKDSKTWIDAKKAWYVLTDKTPMKYGFGAREKRGKNSIDFEQMQLKMLRGENLTDPRVRKKLLGI